MAQSLDCPLTDVEYLDAYNEFNPAGEEALARTIALAVGTADGGAVPSAHSEEVRSAAGGAGRKRSREELEEDELCAYEQQRRDNMAHNRQVLEQLGLLAPRELSLVREETHVQKRQAALRKELVGEERDKFIDLGISYSSGEIYPVPTARDYGLRQHQKGTVPPLPYGATVTVEWADLKGSTQTPPKPSHPSSTLLPSDCATYCEGPTASRTAPLRGRCDQLQGHNKWEHGDGALRGRCTSMGDAGRCEPRIYHAPN